LIVNHIDKIFVSNDAATILQEINVHHPAANLIVLASKMQKDDFGDNTNYVVTLAGELISQAESLLKMGLHPSDIVQGFEIGLKKCIEILESQVSVTVTNPKDEVALSVIESVLASKLPNNYKFFAKLVYDGC
jgi:T-complex protein 1 subunit theta